MLYCVLSLSAFRIPQGVWSLESAIRCCVLCYVLCAIYYSYSVATAIYYLKISDSGLLRELEPGELRRSSCHIYGSKAYSEKATATEIPNSEKI